jgi:HSP20 family protein
VACRRAQLRAFHRAIALPFEPNEDSIDAHFDKGVLHLKVKKPAEVEKAKKTIQIKAGPPGSPAAKTA